MIEVLINGEQHQLSPHTTLTQLIEQMSLTNRRIAIECNGEIIPRSEFTEKHLTQGDQLEIVVAVGGG